MRCVVFGGNGFIGSHLVEKLVSNGHQVRIFDRPNVFRLVDPEIATRVEWFDGDFTNGDDVRHALDGCEICFHLISTTLPKSSNDNPIYDVQTNLIGTLGLLEHGQITGLKKVVFLSSGGTVYGIPSLSPIPESHPTDPTCSYGIGKLTIEKYLHLYQLLHGIDYCVLRLSNPFGERQRIGLAQGAVAVFLGKVLQGKPVELWGDGSVVRDYVYIHDVVEAMMKTLDYSGQDRVFNIGSGEGRSLNQILDDIEAVTGLPVDRRYLAGRPFDVPVNVLETSKAQNILEWRPATTFRDGLGYTADWLKHELARSTKE